MEDVKQLSSSPIKKQLTPTREHPLCDLAEITHEADEVYSSEEELVKNNRETEKDVGNNGKKLKNDENRNKVDQFNNWHIDDNQNQSSLLPVVSNTNVKTEMLTKESTSNDEVKRVKSSIMRIKNQKALKMFQSAPVKSVIENDGFESDTMEKMDGNENGFVCLTI